MATFCGGGAGSDSCGCWDPIRCGSAAATAAAAAADAASSGEDALGGLAGRPVSEATLPVVSGGETRAEADERGLPVADMEPGGGRASSMVTSVPGAPRIMATTSAVR